MYTYNKTTNGKMLTIVLGQRVIILKITTSLEESCWEESSMGLWGSFV